MVGILLFNKNKIEGIILIEVVMKVFCMKNIFKFVLFVLVVVVFSVCGGGGDGGIMIINIIFFSFFV